MKSTYIGTANIFWAKGQEHYDAWNGDPDALGHALIASNQGPFMEFAWLETGPDNLSVTVQGDRESVERIIEELDDEPPVVIHVILN